MAVNKSVSFLDAPHLPHPYRGPLPHRRAEASWQQNRMLAEPLENSQAGGVNLAAWALGLTLSLHSPREVKSRAHVREDYIDYPLLPKKLPPHLAAGNK